jgi:hypothetical protein
VHPNEIRVNRRDIGFPEIVQRLPQPATECGHSCFARYTVTPHRRGASSIATTRAYLLQGKSFLTALRRGAVFTRLSPPRAIWLDDG